MAESTFTLTFGDLRKEIWEFLYGGQYVPATDAADTYGSHKSDVVTRMIKSGLRQAYSPPAVGEHMHDWSFLKPVTSFSLNAQITAGTVTYTHTNRRVVFTVGHGLTEATAPNYKIEIDGVNYNVDSQHDGNNLVLPTTDNPGADISTASTSRLHQDDYDLPDDFGRIMGDLTFSEKDKSWHTVKIVGENRIREMRQRDYSTTSTVDPYYAAIRPEAQSTTDATGSRQVIQFWPAISSAVTVSYRYRVRASHDVTEVAKHPYGASDHSELILSSCLAVAEQRLDNERGPYYARFMDCLMSSIELDARSNRAENLGYNGDGSDGMSLYEGKFTGSDRIQHKNISGTFID